MTIKSRSGKDVEKMLMVYYDALSQHLTGCSEENHKNYNQEQQFLDQDLDLAPSKSGVLPTQPERLLVILYKYVTQ
jgi:hypothetical protein